MTAFKGEKRVILSTSSWIGGKNPFLGIAYIVVGSLCIICGVVFLFVHLNVRTRFVYLQLSQIESGANKHRFQIFNKVVSFISPWPISLT